MRDWRADVLKFWFGLDSARWWKSDAELDHRIRQGFLKLWAEKRQLPVESFLGDALSALAAVILFDQFPRNIFRGHADQFATDHLALAIAKAAVDKGYDEELQPRERGFLYMPFQHSENLADQTPVAVVHRARRRKQIGFAKTHHDVIARFGRFPHRNAMLGRAPRPEGTRRGRSVALVTDLVQAARFNWAYQAELARTFLESHGIEAIVFDTQSNFYSDGAMVGRAADGPRRAICGRAPSC